MNNNETFVYSYKVSTVDVVNLDGPGVLNKLLSLPTTIPELQAIIYDCSIVPLLNLVIILEAKLAAWPCPDYLSLVSHLHLQTGRLTFVKLFE